MRDPIEVNYVPDGDDWLVTAVGRGQRLTGKAPGLIAARDRADQLVEKLAPEEEHRRVVHLLNGDALAFTSAYLSARLARPMELPAETTTPEPEAPTTTLTTTPTAPPAEPKVPSPTPSAERAAKASTS